MSSGTIATLAFQFHRAGLCLSRLHGCGATHQSRCSFCAASGRCLAPVRGRLGATALACSLRLGRTTPRASSSGLPDSSGKRMPSSPACTINSSPRSNSTSERLSASEGGGAVSSYPTGSVRTSSGSEALQNFPAPANTYAKACRVVSTGSVLRRPGGGEL